MVETMDAATKAAIESSRNARNIRKTTLPNGLTVLTEEMPLMRSVALGVWVGTGSRDESAEQTGLSHFVEHMVFKGSRRRSARQIAMDADAIGGNLDAFTGKETICFSIKVLDENLRAGMDILSDLVLNPVFAPEDVEREKDVILEEIKMDEDNPDYLVHEIHTSNFWKGDALGRPILGTKKSVKSFTPAAVRSFHRQRFSPANMIVSAAGHLHHDQLITCVRDVFDALEAGEAELTPGRSPQATPHITLRDKPSLEQVQLCLGVPAPPVDSPDRYVLYMLNTILGGGMSSRLFQTVREDAGLAYSIYSELSPFRDTGALSIYAGTSLEKTPEMLRLILQELRLIKSAPVSTEELKRAKDQSKGNIVLGLESSSSRMANLARQQMYYGRFASVDEIVGEIDQVTAADLQRVANELFLPEWISVTLLGNLAGYTLERSELVC